MADEEKKEEEGGKKGGGGLLPIINLVLLLLLLGVGGFIAWKLMQMEQAAPEAGEGAQAKVEAPAIPEAEDENPDAPPILIDINNITVNLADTEESRFLRAKIKLEVRSEEAKAKVEQAMPKINDLLITVLSSKTFAEI
ncbi:MAG: flagellar basal body-associated FliL family protein, partial [Mariprofundaceae bacterium]